jgi:hypothetical protein
MPAKGPSPTAIRKTKIITKLGITRSTDKIVLTKVLITPLLVVFLAAKNARKIAIDPPISVPKNAIEIVWNMDRMIWSLLKSIEKLGGVISPIKVVR